MVFIYHISLTLIVGMDLDLAIENIWMHYCVSYYMKLGCHDVKFWNNVFQMKCTIFSGLEGSDLNWMSLHGDI